MAKQSDRQTETERQTQHNMTQHNITQHKTTQFSLDYCTHSLDITIQYNCLCKAYHTISFLLCVQGNHIGFLENINQMDNI